MYKNEGGNADGYVFCLKTCEYFEITKFCDYEEIIRQISLLSLYSPLLIDVKVNFYLFTQIMKSLNKNSDFILEHINIQKSDIDFVYRILKEVLYVNFNYFSLDSNDEKYLKLLKKSVKIFYFINTILCFNNDDSEIDIVQKILIDEFKFIKVSFQELSKNYFKVKKQKKYFDDSQIDQCNKNYLIEQQLLRSFLHSSDNIGLNIKFSTKKPFDKIPKNLNSLLEKEEKVLHSMSPCRRKFDLLGLYIVLINQTFTNMYNYIVKLTLEGEMFKESYLDLRKNETKPFYQNLIKFEEKVYNLTNEIRIKHKFIEYFKLNLTDSKQKKEIYNILLMSQQFSTNKNKEKFLAAIQGFSGKVLELEQKIKKQITIIDMIKKTIKIFLDDNKYLNIRKLNYLLLILTILQYLASQGFCLASWFSVNLKLPFKSIESYFPFISIILFMIILSLGQLYVFYKYRHLIF